MLVPADHVFVGLQFFVEEQRVFDFEPSVLVLPLSLVNIFEVLLVRLHVRFESALPTRLEVNELYNIIGDVTQVQKNHHHV